MEEREFNFTRKLKKVNISSNLLLSICKEGLQQPIKVINPLPEDAEVHSVVPLDYGVFQMIVTSEEFEELEIGKEIPQVTIEFETIEVNNEN